MDVVSALAAVSQAIGIAKELRDLDKDFGSAVYKAQIADLYSNLADVKIALSDANESIHQKDKKIRELEEKVVEINSGSICPLCQSGRMKVTASKPHPHFSFAGVQERTIKCQNAECGHSEKRLFDPDNVTGTNKR